jgi:hypothetical protein
MGLASWRYIRLSVAIPNCLPPCGLIVRAHRRPSPARSSLPPRRRVGRALRRIRGALAARTALWLGPLRVPAQVFPKCPQPSRPSAHGNCGGVRGTRGNARFRAAPVRAALDFFHQQLLRAQNSIVTANGIQANGKTHFIPPARPEIPGRRRIRRPAVARGCRRR